MILNLSVEVVAAFAWVQPVCAAVPTKTAQNKNSQESLLFMEVSSSSVRNFRFSSQQPGIDISGASASKVTSDNCSPSLRLEIMQTDKQFRYRIDLLEFGRTLQCHFLRIINEICAGY